MEDCRDPGMGMDMHVDVPAAAPAVMPPSSSPSTQPAQPPPSSLLSRRSMSTEHPSPVPSDTASLPEKQQDHVVQADAVLPTTQSSPKPSPTLLSQATTRTTPPARQSACVAFVRRGKRYRLAEQTHLRNSLLAGIGFLELANALDFPANVWNDYPVPIYADVLMALGGVVALAMALYTVKDYRLSRANIRTLDREKNHLLSQRQQEELHPHPSHNAAYRRLLSARLNLNYRERGAELVDRLIMEILLGFGLVLVGVGTLIALAGEHPKIFLASNLLSGYIGNASSAVYGLLNLVWSIYMFRRGRRQELVAKQALQDDPVVKAMLGRRVKSVSLHAVLTAVTGVVAGAMSMVTAERWWGYIPLIPCIISSIASNWLWRHRIGYDRPDLALLEDLDEDSILRELHAVAHAERTLQDDGPEVAFETLIPRPDDISSVLDFLFKYDLYEAFCKRLLKNHTLAFGVLGPLGDSVTVNSREIEMADRQYVPQLLEIARKCLKKYGRSKLFYRQRYLLEMLGGYFCIQEVDTNDSPSSPARTASTSVGTVKEGDAKAEMVQEKISDSPARSSRTDSDSHSHKSTPLPE